MSNEPAGTEKKFDPFEPWRGVRDAYMEAWSKGMVDTVNTESYAKAAGAVLDTYLTASAPFKETLEKSMVKALEQLNMPSRAEFVVLADRLTNIEMRLDDMDAKLDSMLSAFSRAMKTPERGKEKESK